MTSLPNSNGRKLTTRSRPFGPDWLVVAFSRIHEAALVSDEEGFVAFMNPAAEELTGWMASEAVGQPLDAVFQVLDEMSGQCAETPSAKTLEKSSLNGFENSRHLLSKQGTKKNIEQTAVPIQDEEGQSAGVLYFFREVPEDREATIEESERRFRQVIEALPMALYTTDAEGIITLFNEAAVELWGRRPERGDQWCGSWRIFWPDGSPMPLEDCPMGLVLRTGRSVHGKEIVVQRPDGTRRNVLPFPEPLFDSKGTIIGAVNMLVDITDRKQMEQSLKLLAEASQSLSALVDYQSTLGKSPSAQKANPQWDQAGGRRIVVVDDNVGAAKLLSRLLAMLGDHQIHLAHDGNSALELIQAVHPEVALLDIGLPLKNGYEVAEAIRANSKFDDLLLVALTGYGQKEDLQKSKAAGFDLHCVKPPSMDQMKEILKHPKLNANSERHRKELATCVGAMAGAPPSGSQDSQENQPVSVAMDVPKLRHDLNNVSFVLSLVEEMFSNHSDDPEMMKQAGAALNSEVNRINRMVEMLRAQNVH